MIVGSAQEESGSDGLILIGLGANLPSRFGPPLQTLAASLAALQDHGIAVTRQSRWWRSQPLPVSDQPWFVNGVVAVQSALAPMALLQLLHRIEAEFGRVRAELNGPRLLDLDLLAHGRVVSDQPALRLPHPRLHQRAFVLLPLAEIAPDWRHPLDGRTADMMVAGLDREQKIEVI